MFANKKVVIWGCGDNLIKKLDYVIENIRPSGLVDSDSKHWGKEIIPGCICMPPSFLKEKETDVIVISPEKLSAIDEIRASITDNKIEAYTLNELWEQNEINLQKKAIFSNKDERVKHFACSLGDSVCNIGCSYCYLNYQGTGRKKMGFLHSIEFMIKSVSVSRMGGSCFFNMCSNGETLLKPGIIDFVRGLLEEGHYVCLITNATVKKQIDEFLTFPLEIKKRLLFHCSLHFIELKKRGLVDSYFENINKMINAGISVSMSVIGSDEYIPYRDEIKRLAKQKTGAIPYISACRTEDDYNACDSFKIASKYDWDDYMDIWSGFSGHSLDMRAKTLGKITIPCYAGINSGMIDFESGILRSCVPGDILDNIYDDIKRPIKFYKEPHGCKWGFCSHNGIFLSGRTLLGEKLPTWKEAVTASDELISDEIRKATDYCSDY